MIPNYTWFGRENKIRIPKDDKMIIVENEVDSKIYSYKEREVIYYERAWRLFIEKTLKALISQYDEDHQEVHWEQTKGVFLTKIHIVPRLSLAVDFDGTLFKEGAYPVPGLPIEKNINLCKRWRELDLVLILYTAREGQNLDIALTACQEQGLEFDYVNENLPWAIEQWGDHRKVVADFYLDDRAVSTNQLIKILEG